jgi:hypothetical protein
MGRDIILGSTYLEWEIIFTHLSWRTLALWSRSIEYQMMLSGAGVFIWFILATIGDCI